MRTTSGHTERCFFILILATLTAPLPAVAQEEAETAAREATALLETPHTLAELAGKQAVVETDRGEFIIDLTEAQTDESGRAVERIVIRSVPIRDQPAPQAAPFAGDSVEQLAGYRAILATTSGAITIQFMPEIAPEHVRNFLRLASLGVFDGMSFHRVVEGMLIQTGWLGSRERPLDEGQQRYVTTLQPEFSGTPHVRGIVSMARGDDPASADTSFFICTATVSTLDSKYTVFGRVVDGMTTVDSIESLPLDGETPTQRVEILGVQIAR